MWFYFHISCMWVVQWGLLLRLSWFVFVTVRTRGGGGAAAWIIGVLAAPGTQGGLAARVVGHMVL